MTSMTTVEPWYRNTCYAWVSKGGSGKRIPIKPDMPTKNQGANHSGFGKFDVRPKAQSQGDVLQLGQAHGNVVSQYFT